MIRDNLIAFWQLGAFGSPQSREFIDGLNGAGQAGMEGPDGKYKVLSIDATGPDAWHVDFKLARVGTVMGFDFTANDLAAGAAEPFAAIAQNLRAFLRLGGFASLTPAAIAAVKAWRFVV
jgi:hypothetical protein